MIRRLLSLFVLITVTSILLGCASNQDCSISNGTIQISPLTATADHTGVPPRNQVQFYADPTHKPGCYYPQVIGSIRNATWTATDSLNVTISNQNDASYGLATCLNPASNVTITATMPDGAKSSATLSCQ